MRPRLIIFLIFLTCATFVYDVSGHCDTHQYSSPNLKFLKILTAGTYQVQKSNREVRDGQDVYLYCSNKTFLYDSVKPSKIKCENSVFDRNLPSCYMSCDEPVYDASTTTITCTGGDCNGRQLVGTEVEIICRPGFDTSKNAKRQIRCSETGFWDSPLYSCGSDDIQIKPTAFLYGGTLASSDTAPWHVGIYKSTGSTYVYRCGGSLISTTLVATAAHCFGKTSRPEQFVVVVGSLKSEFNPKEKNLHYNIINFELSESLDAQHLVNDFAIAVLDRPVDETNTNVQILKMPTNEVQLGTEGLLAGWGATGKTEKSDTLLFTNLTIKECENHVSDFCRITHTTRKTIEKCTKNGYPGKRVFCPKHALNDSAPCTGDSGSGLVIQQNDKLYLAGVVSGVLNMNPTCLPRSDVLFADAREYYDFFMKILNRLKFPSKSSSSKTFQKKSCPGTDVFCGEQCIPLTDLCDKVKVCGKTSLEKQCQNRATHQMLITGLSILKYIGSLKDFTSYTYPNWIVPAASLWSLFNFLSEASDPSTSQKLQDDFGVISNPSVNTKLKNLIQNAHIVSSSSYTKTEPEPATDLIKKHFRHVYNRSRRASWFYSAAEDRITGNLDYDFNHSFEYLGKSFDFVTFERQTVQAQMICSVSDHKVLTWEKFAHVIDVKINATTRMIMIKPDDPREPLDSVMNALKVWPIKNLRKLGPKQEHVGVCFPRFKVLIEADYSAILFKMGYDYMFTPERVNLERLNARNVRVHMNARAFVKIWDADNDYDDPTVPYDIDTKNHFIVDNPFVFILYDSKTNLPWLVGKLNNPTMYRHYTSSASRYRMFP